MTTTARKSYVLTGKRETHAAAKATAAVVALNNTAMAARAKARNVGTDDAKATATAAAKLANSAAIATATANAARTTATATAAAAALATAATATADYAAAAALKEYALATLTVGGVYAAMDATAAKWAAMRSDVESAEYRRHDTAKASTMQLVVKCAAGGTVYLTVNTTAAADWRKIDAAFDRKLANRAARAAKKAAK